MQIKFSKMHGLGNEFMVIDALHQPFSPQKKIIRSWAQRDKGIGFDQLLLLEKSDDDSDCALRIFNADGSQAGQCGNGVRCVALFMKQCGITTQDVVRIKLSERTVNAAVLDTGEVQVDMGVPIFTPADIPLRRKQEQQNYQFTVAGKQMTGGVVSLGNPHVVFQVENIDAYPVAEKGKIIQADPAFPQSVNVGFMQIMTRSCICLRVFERGVGETAACGSGACAAVVVGRRCEHLDTNVRVEMSAGALDIEWLEPGTGVKMTGPAEFVHHGVIDV